MRSMLPLPLLLVTGCNDCTGPDLGGINLSSPDVARPAQELDSVTTASIADTLSVSTVQED